MKKVYIVFAIESDYYYDENVVSVFSSYELAENAIKLDVQRTHERNIERREELTQELKELAEDDMDWYEEVPDIHNDPLWEDWELDAPEEYNTYEYRIEEFGLDEEA